MVTWRLQLKIHNPKYAHTFEETLNFCRENNAIGIGWYIANKYDDYNKLREQVKTNAGWGTGALKAINAMRKMEVNDLIWTRLGEDASQYYLVRIIKRWIDCPDIREFDEYDLSNYVAGEWINIGKMDKVPGKVVSSLCSRSTVQRVYDVDEISKFIWNKYSGDGGYKYDINKLSMDDFWNMIGSEELECLILLYLQCKKNYLVYSSTLKNSTPKYEAVMIAWDGSHRCFPQIKKNTPLDPCYYAEGLEKNDRVYLFTTSENYGVNTHPQVECISKSEIEKFIYDYKKILPDTIKYWLDMIN